MRSIEILEADRPSGYLPSSRSIAFAKLNGTPSAEPGMATAGQDDAFVRVLRTAGAVVHFAAGALSSWNPGQSLAGYLQACFIVPCRGRGRYHHQTSGAAVGGLWIRTGSTGALPSFDTVQLRRNRRLGGPRRAQQCRIWRSRTDSPDGLAASVLVALAVVLGADVASAAGYPHGPLE